MRGGLLVFFEDILCLNFSRGVVDLRIGWIAGEGWETFGKERENSLEKVDTFTGEKTLTFEEEFEEGVILEQEAGGKGEEERRFG